MSKIESTIDGKFMIYRDKPLIREGNIICYGDMRDKYIMFMMILTEKEIILGNQKEKVPDKIIVQIIKSDPNVIGINRMVKQFEKNGLMEALNIGLIWLERLNNE